MYGGSGTVKQNLDRQLAKFVADGRKDKTDKVMVGPIEATYQDIIENERIVTTYNMWMDEAMISVSLATFEFKAEGEKYVGEVEINFTLKDE